MIRWVLLFSWMTFAMAEPCQIQLLNGDLLHGIYLGQEKEWTLLKTKWQESPLQIHGKYIESIDFGRKPILGDSEWEIDLGNEQRLVGDRPSFQNGRINFVSSWAGNLDVDEAAIKSLYKSIPASKIIYRGPMSLNTWRFEAPRGRSGVLGSAEATLGAEGMMFLKDGDYTTMLPATIQSFGLRIRMRFEELAPLGRFSINLNILPDQNQSPRPIHFSIEKRQLRLRLQHRNKPQEDLLFPLAESAIRVGVPFELQFDVDKANKRFRLLLDQHLIAEWEEVEWEFSQSLHPFFLSFKLGRDGFSTMRIEDVILYELESGLPVKTNEGLVNLETVRFVNGDVLPMKWEGVSPEGNWLLMVSGRETPLAMSTKRIEQWKRDSSQWFPIKRKANHVQLQLAGGRDRFIAELLGADDNEIRLKREGVNSEFRIPLTRLERIGFNPYFKK